MASDIRICSDTQIYGPLTHKLNDRYTQTHVKHSINNRTTGGPFLDVKGYYESVLPKIERGR
jgi:hypothetical protein